MLTVISSRGALDVDGKIADGVGGWATEDGLIAREAESAGKAVGIDKVAAAGDAGVGALAVLIVDGRNVAFFPLKTCQLSHNMTIEKPKITHKMVRRMSFMKGVFGRR